MPLSMSLLMTTGKSFTDAKTKLQQSINDAAMWFNNNLLSVNTNKTVCMTLGTLSNMNKLSDEEKSAALALDDTNLEQFVSCPYLGVHVDQHLKWDGHILNLCKTISQKLAVLCRLRKVLSKMMLCQQYLLCIQPCIDYAISVWGSCSEQNKALISRSQHRAARIVIGNLTSSMLGGQISWKNLGGNLLIHDVITIPQRSCTNALTKWPPYASLTKSLWLQMFTHIPQEMPSMVMYRCPSPILNYIVNRLSIVQLSYGMTCPRILRMLLALTNSSIFIRNTSLINVVTVLELFVYTYTNFLSTHFTLILYVLYLSMDCFNAIFQCWIIHVMYVIKTGLIRCINPAGPYCKTALLNVSSCMNIF